MSKHNHNWIIQANDIRYRDIDLTEWVMDVYVCECGAGKYLKTLKEIHDLGLKTVLTEELPELHTKNVCIWYDGTLRALRGHNGNCSWTFDGQVWYHNA